MARILSEEEQQIADRLNAAQRGELVDEEELAAVEAVMAGEPEPAPVIPFGGGAGVAHSTATRRSTLSAAVAEFDPLVERLDKAVARARMVADRINGTRPQQGRPDDPVKHAKEPALIASVRARKDHMVRALDALDRELSIIEESL